MQFFIYNICCFHDFIETSTPIEKHWITLIHYKNDVSYLHLQCTSVFFLNTVFIVLRAAVRAPVSLAVLFGFTCLVAFVYFVYFYEQIND